MLFSTRRSYIFHKLVLLRFSIDTEAVFIFSLSVFTNKSANTTIHQCIESHALQNTNNLLPDSLAYNFSRLRAMRVVSLKITRGTFQSG